VSDANVQRERTSAQRSSAQKITAFKIAVLKFGSSVLASTSDLPRAVHEVYAHLRRGYRVVAVVSAIGDTTDRLLAEARTLSERPEPRDLAELLAGGERESAALFALALARSGVPARVLEPTEGVVTARGPVLDAVPIAVDRARVAAAFSECDVVVLPGFFARGEGERCVLLGRGGSDLSAVFAAAELDAARCVLLKDVDGLYESDPAAVAPGAAAPRRYAALSFEDAERLGGDGEGGIVQNSIVQHKAVRLARERGLVFEVGALGRAARTLVGASATRFDTSSETELAQRPLTVGLVGLGTVGAAVARALAASPRLVQVAAVLVRDAKKPRDGSVDPRIVTSDVDAFFAAEFDVLVELAGGVEAAGAYVRRALESGRHVVSANKALLAEDGEALQSIARRCGRRLVFGAAVGGALPVLERIASLVDDGREIAWVAGVLSGTVGFVLEQLGAGVAFASAVARAQERGLAEADPTLDLDGSDAASKVALVARAIGARHVRSNGRDVLDERAARRAAAARANGRKLVQVARVDRIGVEAVTSVRLLELEEHHPLARARGEENAVLIGLSDGETVSLRGLGAGAWPTAEAVIGDLFALASEGARRRVEVLP
jgi:homoserine dehydrogenase